MIQVDRDGRRVIALVFLLTGAAALVLQITWQRVIALHAGVDLESSAIVVAAFLGGLGLGTLAGGRIADRLGGRRALFALGATNAALAGFSLVSVWLLYDVYRDLVSGIEWPVARLVFNGLILLVPTFLQGLSLPLVARAVTTDVAAAGSQIGRFNAANTVGAALGAFGGGWFLLGQYSFVEVAQMAASVQLAAAVVFVGLGLATRRDSRLAMALGGLAVAGLVLGAVRLTGQVVRDIALLQRIETVAVLGVGVLAYLVGLVAFVWPARAPVAADEARAVAAPEPVPEAPTDPARPVGPPWVWYVAYGITGAVALGFELVYFRLIDGVMRSNSYTFAHVLGLYLGLLGVGVAVGSWVRPRVRDDRRAFLWLQFGVGLSAVLALVVFTRVLPNGALGDAFAAWFGSDGFAAGFSDASRGDRLLFGAGVPLLLMGAPVLLMGAAFPFVQGLVTTDLDTVGRRTGALVFANLVGNVAGTLLTGFVLIDRFGTIGSYLVLVVPLVAAGLVAAALGGQRTVRVAQSVAVVAVVVVAAVALPGNDRLWATLHDTPPDEIVVAEDRSCASALKLYGDDRSQLTINGAGQNGYPFDDFHVLIGLLPALAQDDGADGLAIGLGIGSTSFAMLASERTGSVTSVELCGGNYDLVDGRAAAGLPEFELLRDDPRHREVIGDGRRFLLVTDDRFDLIVPDTVRPNSAGSGNLYSREFQELVSSRLADRGITAGWVPTYRSLNSVTTTFPYVVGVTVASYNDSEFYLASRSPLELDPAALVERFDSLPDGTFPADQHAALRVFLEELDPVCYNDGRVASVTDPTLENRDLHPRDEYFTANGGIGEEQVARTCGG